MFTRRTVSVISAVGAALASVLLVSGCASSSSGGGSTSVANPYNLITPGTIVASASGDQPPFAMLDSSGAPAGFDIDLLNAVAKKLDLKVEYKQTPVDSGIEGLASKQYDMVANGLGVTDERKKTIAFTKGVYWSSTAYLTQKSSTISSAADLSGKKVAVITGTVQVQYLDAIEGAKAVEYASSNAAVSALQSGTVDAFIDGGPDAESYAKKLPTLKIAATAPVDHETALAVQKDNTALSDAFNKEIGAMIDDGEFQKIYDKYFTEKPVEQLVSIWPALGE